MNREPILTQGAVVSTLTSLLAVAVSFGVDLTKEQQAAILGLSGVIYTVGTWLLARRHTTPWSDVIEAVDAAGDVVDGPAAADHAAPYEGRHEAK